MERVGPYELRGELARGAAGVVHRAWDPGLGREVALKLLRRGGDAGDAERRRFRREAEALARISHRNVVRVHAAGDHESGPYLVMELVEGETLQARIDRQGRLPPREAADLVQRLARGLQAAHRAGILHRDIKPDNVLLSRSTREPLLTDFGLAKDLSATQSRSRLSIRGRFLGTPGYWPPEQARGELEQMGPTSDVYALGATLWATLVGRPPFEADSLIEALVAAQEQPAAPPSRHATDVPAALDLIVLGCLEKDPARRYAGAEPLAEDLERFLRGAPVVGPQTAPVGLPRPRLEITLRPRRRLPDELVKGAAALVLLLGLAVAAALLLTDRHSTDRRRGGPAAPLPSPTSDASALDELLVLAQRDPAAALARAGALPEALRADERLQRALSGARRQVGTSRLRAALREAPRTWEARIGALEALTRDPQTAGPAALEAARLTARAARDSAPESERAAALAAALAVARRVADEDPLSAEPWLLVAELAPGEAEQALHRASRLEPAASAALARALWAESRGDTSGARAQIDQALLLDAQDPRTWLCRTRSSWAQGRLSDAIMAAETAWDLDPLEPAGLVLWSEALLELGAGPEQRRTLLEAMTQASQLAPHEADLPAARARLRLPRQDGQLDLLRPGDPTAVAEAEEAMRLDPQALRPNLALAEVRLHAGLADEAARAAEAAARADPTSYQAWRLLARTRPPGRAREEALEAALRCVGERGPVLTGGLHLELAAARRLAGDDERAVGDVSLAMQLLPDSALPWLERGRIALAAHGRLQEPARLREALDAFTTALTRDPRLAEAHLGRAQTRLTLGQATAALTDLEQVDRLLGQGAEVDHHTLALTRGEALYLAGRLEESEEALAGFIQRAPAEHPWRARARELLTEIDRRLRDE